MCHNCSFKAGGAVDPFWRVYQTHFKSELAQQMLRELRIGRLDPAEPAAYRYRPPQLARVDMYKYEMAAPLWELAPRYLGGEAVAWWRRAYEEPLVPPVRLDAASGRLVRAQPAVPV